MPRLSRREPAALAVVVTLLFLSGCAGFRDYVHRGFKVGPDYGGAAASVASHWIDQGDRVRAEPANLYRWWFIFNDPVLDGLVESARRQNLTFREAGLRVLAARAELAISRGNLFPQQQNAAGSYRHQESSLNPPTDAPAVDRLFDQWNLGFNLSWELDFWGRFRRSVAAAENTLEASVADYDQALVTLLGDVATNYTQVRTDQERIKLLRANVKVQEDVLNFLETRARLGFRTTDLDVAQARSNLKQTVAAFPALEIDLRQATNRLCTLLGQPPMALAEQLGQRDIPAAPADVVVGIPADLLRRRPDLRSAERQAAAQAEQIGISQADFYPIVTISVTLGYQAREFSHLFSTQAFTASTGPSFQWNILNYGRIANNVRLQDARFQQLLVAYQNAVLQAAAEVEDGLVTFLQAQERTRRLAESVDAAKLARDIAFAQYEKSVAGVGNSDFNRYAVLEQNRIVQQDLWAQARGQIAQGLIQVYRALGGGWEIRHEPPTRVPGVGTAPVDGVVPRTSPERPLPIVPAPLPVDNPPAPPAAGPAAATPQGTPIAAEPKRAPAR